MTFNGSWGYMPTPPEDWHSVREVLGHAAAPAPPGGGNLLLNIGPTPDGSVPPEAARAADRGRQVARENGEAVYGTVDRTDGKLDWGNIGNWTLKGNAAYYWCRWWPGKEIAIGGLLTKVVRASLLATGEPVEFEQTGNRLLLKGLPATSPDKIAGVAVIKLGFNEPPLQKLGTGYVVL